MVYHISALLNQSIDGLNVRPDGVYVDVTFGGGGHSMEILKRLTSGRLIAFDQDEEAGRNVPDDHRILFINQNYRFLSNNLRYYGIESINGLIADLGVSFHQFDEPSRGFTFRQNAPLDMRMNTGNKVTASHLLNTLEEEELASLLFEYGELPGARKIAGRIAAIRKEKPLECSDDLIAAVGGLAPPRNTHKFYARLFQALRIAVNQEITALKEMLVQALALLGSGGRLVVITYHSLEDRLVKNFMRTGSFEATVEKDFFGNIVTPFRLITRKGITPDETEVAINNRARSARLRIAEKI